MLQLEAGWVAVLDGDRFLGVLTPESLHAALRRSVEGAAPETAGATRELAPRRAPRPLLQAPVARAVPRAPVVVARRGTRHTDSSRSAATTSPTARTAPMAAVTVSPAAAASRPTCGPTYSSTPTHRPAKPAPT